MKQIYILITLIFFFSAHLPASAQDCNCDHVITPANTYINGETMNIQPGDVICIKAGKYKYLNLFNFSGTADKPITFKNCGGQVYIGGYQHYYGLILNNVNYFRFTGTGTSGVKYGFKIDGVNNTGSGVAGYGTHAEIDHLEISRTGFAGILYKNDPSCDPKSWRQNFVMRQVSVHDNYIHDTKGEGIYIGYTGGARTLSCNGKSTTVYPHNIEGLKVFNNRIENTGWDGLQISRAVKDCEIFNNTIKNFGTAREKYQDEGILIGGGTTGKVYNNTIIKGTGVGIQVFGTGDNYIYNNIIANVEEDGIFCDDRETTPGKGFHFINNTIVNPGQAGMKMYSKQSSGNVFYNNIVAGASQDIVLLNAPIDWKASNNIFVRNISEAGFVDPGKYDYHLKKGSPAIDKGKDVSSYGIRKDFANDKRPQGSAYDIGAYEHGAASSNDTPGNQSPTVDAGTEVTLTLPSNSTTLTATAKDPDGTISKYAWSQVSGPSVATLSGQSTTRLKASKLQEGIYTFKVQVTDNSNATGENQVNVVVKSGSAKSAGTHGLHYSYYEGNWDRLPDFNRLSAKKTGTLTNFSLKPRSKNEYYGFTFEGYIDIKTSGQYTFYTASDDGSALYINGKKIVDNDGLHARQERSGNISLSKGLHAIKVTYFDKWGNNDILEVYYSGPGISKRPVPDDVLYVNPNHARVAQGKKDQQTANSTEFSDLAEIQPFSVLTYPNPVEDVFYLAVEGYLTIPQGTTVAIMDLRGKTIDLTGQLQYEENKISINTTPLALPAGIYILSLTTPDAITTKVKFIKN